jgi:hypothetical protein
MSIRFSRRRRALGAVVVAVLSLGLVGAGTAAASGWKSHQQPTLFVNGSVLSGYAHGPCSTAHYTTITAAVAAAAPGSHKVVCPGTYHEGVLIEKP